MRKVIDITKYTPLSTEKFLFDNSALIPIFCPVGEHDKAIQKHYSKFLDSCKRAGAEIVICSISISEFFNKYVRLDYDIWRRKQENPDQKRFKQDYRNTDLYKESAKSAYNVINNHILQTAKRIPDKFPQLNIEKLFDGIENSDFNDNYYAYISEIEKYIIVTDDKDFQKINFDVTIVTAQPS